jgi:hypothetical protein
MIRQGGVEMNKLICWKWCWMGICAALAAACGSAPLPQSAQTPRLVAAYPQPPSALSAAQSDPDGPVVRECVYLILQVDYPEGAADAAARSANRYGGYENNRYAWWSDGGRTVVQELYVPICQAEKLRAELISMGGLTSQSVVRHPWDAYPPGESWTQFSVQYIPFHEPVVYDDPQWELFGRALCALAARAIIQMGRLAAGLLLAAAVALPCFLMAVGAVTTVRWILRK